MWPKTVYFSSTSANPIAEFGTTSRIINLVTILQVGTIIASRGDVYLLGEAYAFGVVWSFFLKDWECSALRFQRHDQEYKTPLNLRLGKIEIPVGLILTYFGAVSRCPGKPV